MISYGEMIANEADYIDWLLHEYDCYELGDMVAAIMKGFGQTVLAGMQRALQKLPVADLADFVAENFDFAANDEKWQRYCSKICFNAGDQDNPSLTDEERNGTFMQGE